MNDLMAYSNDVIKNNGKYFVMTMMDSMHLEVKKLEEFTLKNK